MPTYPIVTPTTERQAVKYRAVDAEALTAQLVPIRDALLKLFERAPSRSRGELHWLEVRLAVTEQGDVAFATGTATPSLTLTLGARTRSPSARPTTSRSAAATKPEVVEIA